MYVPAIERHRQDGSIAGHLRRRSEYFALVLTLLDCRAAIKMCAT
jgi:hypothetical protein